MDDLRKPFFWAAAIVLLLTILVELASVAIMPGAPQGLNAGTPGLGIRYLAIIDFLLAYGVTTQGLSLLLPRALVGRLQGIVALVLSFLGCLGTLVLAITAFLLLILMVTLLVAIPFGTIAYMAAWGHFPVGTAEGTLALIMLLKIVFCILLLLAEQRFLQNKGLVILSGLSLGTTWLVAFLIDFPPFFLVSIADAIGALVIAIIGIVWLVLLLIGSLLSLIAVLRSAV
ncbi:MAG TPA: hypothetical protein VG889_07455 [Rhizomicrobium sp.]|nr:hypothetical protein [Rhizomicrobium sp.]